jgi:predicted membrane metal-binding protein
VSVDPPGLKHLLRELALPATALFLIALSYFLNKTSVNPAQQKWLLVALVAAIVLFLLAVVRLWVFHKI